MVTKVWRQENSRTEQVSKIERAALYTRKFRPAVVCVPALVPIPNPSPSPSRSLRSLA